MTNKNFVLNYPIETEEAWKFWNSQHKCNEAIAIIAFSLNYDNANDNLRRYGYKYFWRKKALGMFGAFTNYPSMEGLPFYEISTSHWTCLPHANEYCEYLATEDGDSLCTEDYQPLFLERESIYKPILTEDGLQLTTEDDEVLILEHTGSNLPCDRYGVF